MLFLSRLLLRVLPEPTVTRIPGGSGFDAVYRTAYFKAQDEVIAWHRAELERLDYRFRTKMGQDRLMTARKEANARGISPTDPRYPDVFDYLPFPPKTTSSK